MRWMSVVVLGTQEGSYTIHMPLSEQDMALIEILGGLMEEANMPTRLHIKEVGSVLYPDSQHIH
jgi:hypothetical protein